MNIGERLVAVETRIGQVVIDGERREDAQREMLDTLKELKESVDDINNTISKYKGFVGGILFVASSVGIFLSKFGIVVWQAIVGK